MTRQEAKEGTIAAFYTLEGWFVKIKQAYEIEKVCFSFVMKNKKGEGFNIYMNFDKFDNLCDEILSGVFAQKLASDNGKYPNAFKYVCGTNGVNEISIGKGSKSPIVIQGRVKTKNMNAFVPVLNYDELCTMAKWFRRTSQLYIDEMSGYVTSAVMHKPKEEQEQYIPQEAYTQSPVQNFQTQNYQTQQMQPTQQQGALQQQWQQQPYQMPSQQNGYQMPNAAWTQQGYGNNMQIG